VSAPVASKTGATGASKRILVKLYERKGFKAGADAHMIATVDSRDDQIPTGWTYQLISAVLLKLSREARRRQERMISLNSRVSFLKFKLS
jgi:hypothetical protein